MSQFPKHDRLVCKPVFLLSSVRSGSTLLRCILDSHSSICAPHELHLGHIGARIDSEFATLSMSILGLDATSLKQLLWDRVLQSILAQSGKSIIVDKSPSNTFIHDELRACWPDARFLVLRRHPADIATSIVQANDGRDLAEASALVNRFGEALDRVLRDEPNTPVIRYEDLVTDPASTCRQLCDLLVTPYEPAMLDYGASEHGPLIYGVGDWGDRIRTGRIQPCPGASEARPTPPQLVDLTHRWGYCVSSW